MASTWLARILGPRVPAEELVAHRTWYALPSALFLAAVCVLLASLLTPYWQMTLKAPQYPRGLHVHAFVNRMDGDVDEIDGLNHYIGMRALGDAAQVERAIAIQAVVVLVALVLAAAFVHTRWAAILTLPALLFPVGFLADLQYWLWTYGQNLDPKAALSSSVKPFVPPVLGVGRVGQFETIAVPGVGLLLASLASILIVAGLWAHRRAYKPLVDRGAAVPPDVHTAALLLLLVLLPLLPVRSAEAFDLRDAVAKAAPGSTIRVESGVHAAPIVIDRPLTLEGAPGAVIEGGGSGDLVRITAPDVTVRGLTIRGTGSDLEQENAAVLVLAPRARIEDNVLLDDLFGLYLRDAPDSHLRGNRIVGKDLDVARRGDAIRLWSSDRCVIERNEVSHTRDVIVWYSKDVRIVENWIHDSRYGLHFMYANRNVVEGNRLEGNSVGAFLMYSKELTFERNRLAGNRGPSGYGLGMKDVDGVLARGNVMLGNRVGLYLDNSPFGPTTFHDIDENVFAYNDIGISFQPAVQRNRFRDNAFVENLEQVAVSGSGELRGNEFTRDGRGNFWSDYKGFDRGGDGIGDVAHRSESLFENVIDRDAKLRFFLFSPVQQAIELAAAAVPTFKPRPKLVDSAPRMDLPTIKDLGSTRSASWSIAGFAGFLVMGSLAALKTAHRRDGEATHRGAPNPMSSSGVAPAPTVPVPPALAPASSAAAHPASAAASRTTTGEAPLQITSLVKRFGRAAVVDGLSLEMQPGEAVALWGKNGAGKTTAIKCILGLLRGTGSITVAGHDAWLDGKRARAAIGYVPQELALPDDLRAIEAMRFYARLKRVDPGDVEHSLREVDLLEHASKRVGELSGGMKQRLALAVALLSNPPLLVLDEMTSNLDASARTDLLDLLVAQKRRGKTILFTTHRPDEVQALADRIVILERGRTAQVCNPTEFGPAIGLRARLGIRLARPAMSAAEAFLESLCLTFDRSADGLLRVDVPADRKMWLLRELESAGHAVLDFELDEGVGDGRSQRSDDRA